MAIQKDVVWRNINVLVFSLAGFLSDVSQEPGLAILPAFTVSVVGASLAPFYLGFAMGLSEALAYALQVFFGWISTRISFRKWLVASGYFVEGFFMACLGISFTGLQIVLNRGSSRIGKAMRTPARDAMLAASVDEKYYGRAFGLQRAGDTLGAVFGIALLFYLVAWVPHRTVFFITFLPALGASLSILIGATDPRGAIPLSHDWSIFPDLQKMPRNFWLFLVVVGFFGLTKVHAVVLLYKQYNIAHINGLLASQYVMLVYLFYNIARAIHGYVAGKLGDSFNREVLLALFGYGLFGISVICMGPDLPYLYVSIPIFMLLGISDATIRTLEKSLVAQMVPEHLRDTGYGIMYFVKGMGVLGAGVIVGSLWSWYSVWHALMYIGVVSSIAMCSMLCAYWLQIFHNYNS